MSIGSMEECDDDQRTIWCGNLSQQVTEEILYELFLQVDPLQRVNIPKDREGRQNSYGFVTFKHVESVNYAIDLLNGTCLFDKRLNLKPRVKNNDSRASNNISMPSPHFYIDQMQNTDLLMQMGNQLLLDYKSPGNYSAMHRDVEISSTPQRRHNNYRDDRYERSNDYDNRSNRRSRYNNPRQNSTPYNKGHHNRHERHSREWRT